MSFRVLVFVLYATFLGSTACAQALSTGKELQAKLASPAGVAWAGVTLRGALESLGREQRMAVILDRRVDPGREVSFSFRSESLDQLMSDLAQQMGLGVCLVDSVVYFGPTETTKKLPTVAAIRRREAKHLPGNAGSRFLRLQAWSWPMLSAPRDLANELAREAGAEIVNLDQLPHDLWPEVNLPPLALADRLTLVLAGFGMTYQFSPEGTQLQLAPMPETAAIAQTYPGKGRPRENAAILQRHFPSAEVTVEGEMIRVVGPWEVHKDVETLMQGGRVARTRTTPKAGGGRTVYTLQVENEPVGGVINALAERLNLQLKVDPAAEVKLTEVISFNVSDVSRDELFRAVLQPAGLTFRLTNDQLLVLPGG